MDGFGSELDAIGPNRNEVCLDAAAAGWSAMAGWATAVDQLAIPAGQSVVLAF